MSRSEHSPRIPVTIAAQLLQDDPQKFLALFKYASTYPDFPKNFVPPGLTDPNYVPPDNSRTLELLCYCMAIIPTIVVLLRLWIRTRVHGMIFGWDDWLIIPGQLLGLGTIVVILLLIKKGGVGKHIYDVPYDRIVMTHILEFIGVLFYFTAICIIRLSITAFLYRLMGVVSATKRRLLHATVVFLILQFIIQVLTYVFACRPISAGWDMDVRLAGFKSINQPLEIFILTIVYLVTDVWLLVLPIHTIWTLQLPLRTRIGVTWVFVFGGVACAGAVLKTVYIYPVFNSYDPTWRGVGFQVGAVLELGFGVVSASMPALNHILVKTVPQVLDSWFSGTPVSKWFSTGSKTTKPSTKSLKEVFQSKIHGPGAGPVEAYDDVPKTMDEYNSGWDVTGEEAESQLHWEKSPRQVHMEKQLGDSV